MSAFPDVRACWIASAHAEEAPLALQFRIEQDGSIARVCTAPSTTLDDVPAVRCMLDAFLKVRYPPATDDDVEHCGLVALVYPLTLSP